LEGCRPDTTTRISQTSEASQPHYHHYTKSLMNGEPVSENQPSCHSYRKYSSPPSPLCLTRTSLDFHFMRVAVLDLVSISPRRTVCAFPPAKAARDDDQDKGQFMHVVRVSSAISCMHASMANIVRQPSSANPTLRSEHNTSGG
jgi:hypothetical protein